MSEEPQLAEQTHEPDWIVRLARRRPDVVLMAPYLVYLALMALKDIGWFNDLWPNGWLSFTIALRGIGGVAVFWLFRRHMPPLGKAHLGIAIVFGVVAAALWVEGQYLLNRVDVGDWNLGGRLFLFPGSPETADPRTGLTAGQWWTQAVLRITVACTAVPIVEEIFWRGFLLRALIDYDRFERIPLGTFTWLSFLGTSLLSTLQHPDNWGVSILCWFLYNGLMYWKKSLLCLMITHGITNLVLYVYVLSAGGEAWRFW
jgi:CAAX prenyl protease-like protein